MKTHKLILLASLLFATQGCEQKTASVPNASITPSPNTASRSADFQSEALRAAENEWSKVWVQQGDTWIAKAQNGRYLLQIKGKRTEAHAEVLSEADRLNGIQWRGSVAFHCVAARKFGFVTDDGGLKAINDPHAGQHTGWNDWYVPTMGDYKFKKQNDSWTLIENGMKEGWEWDEMIRPTEADLRLSQR